MRLKQVPFYRRVGVRQRESLTRPRLIPLERLILPLQSIYHFVPEDTVTIGPTPQDPTIRNLDGRVFIEHLTQLKDDQGRPRRTAVNPTLLVNDYRRRTRGFKPLRKDTALTMNPKNALVVNYGMLTPLYRYIVSFQANYYRWVNVSTTLWKTVEDTHRRFAWHQYVDLYLPDHIPSLEALRRMEAGRTIRSLELFNTPAALNLFDLWQWLGENRMRSTMAHISDDTAKQVNLIVRVKGYFFVLNLGLLNQWRKDPDDSGDTGLTASQMQMRFVQLLHGLRDIIEGKTEAEVDDGVSDGDIEETEITSMTVGDNEINFTLPIMRLPEPVTPPEPPEPLSIDVTQPPPGRSVRQAKAVPLEEELTETLVENAGQLQEMGLITVKAHQRVIDEAKTFTKLKDPFGSGKSLLESMRYTKEDLELPETQPLPDRKTIPDKTMLTSRIKTYHQKYVKTLMKKDILQSVMAIQKLGVAVKDYQIEEVRDAMNHYQIHTVTLKPLKGRQSTVRFRLPVVDQDGRFISNGQGNRLRLQRAD